MPAAWLVLVGLALPTKFTINNQYVTKSSIFYFNQIKCNSSSEMSNETFLKKMRELIPETIIDTPFSKFLRLFNGKFAELKCTKTHNNEEMDNESVGTAFEDVYGDSIGSVLQRILINPNFWQAVYKGFIRNLLKSGVYRNPL